MIKEIIIVFFCFLSTGIASGQSIFKTIEVGWQGYSEIKKPPITSKSARYYNIAFAKDLQSAFMYPRISELVPSFDTLTAIKELLAYKGDIRICGIPVRGYCPICSSIYMGDKYYYSLQLEALYLLNQLIYDPRLISDPYPVLFDYRSKREISVDEEGITRLFDAYIKWYEKVKHMTMDEIRRLKENPYRDAGVGWVR